MFNVARPRVPGLLFALVFAGVPAGPANLVPSRVSSLTTAVAIAEPVKIGGVTAWRGMSACALRDGRIAWWREYWDPAQLR